jgi:Helicase associated domain
MVEERGRPGGFDDGRLRERVEVLGPDVSLDALRGAVSTMLVERLGVTWDERYGELKRFKERFGHSIVPVAWSENPKLGHWVSTQRTLRNARKLSPSREAKLDEVGFLWELNDPAWEQRFSELLSYKRGFGDCNVPSRWKENPQLGAWVGRQRTLERANNLPSERQLRLDSLGFIWNRHDTRWDTMFAALKEYREAHGHCEVPARWEENPQLAQWVSSQRMLHITGKLPLGRKARLDALGFVWNPQDSTWSPMLAELTRYKERFGDCNVPKRWSENPVLGIWVSTQRARNKEEQISADQKALLDELGFVWDIKDVAWETKFAELKRYRDHFRDCNVPHEFAANLQLGKWVSNQRTRQKVSKLSPSRKARLDELGFSWEIRSPGWESAWEKRFTQLMAYKKCFGDCNVPTRWIKNPLLGSWVARQRIVAQRLSPVRKERLDEVGFDWATRVSNWEARFIELKDYRDLFGDCDVPDAWRENPQLGKWVMNQRVLQHVGKLSPARKLRLDSLGFVWDIKDSNWDARFNELKRYRDRIGDCNVPIQWKESPQLSKWIRNQRALKRAGKLSPPRKARLDELGFLWELKDPAWERRFIELRSYRQRFGDCKVPTRWNENPELGKWVGHQRSRQKAGRLAPTRKARLDGLGFEW